MHWSLPTKMFFDRNPTSLYIFSLQQSFHVGGVFETKAQHGNLRATCLWNLELNNSLVAKFGTESENAMAEFKVWKCPGEAYTIGTIQVLCHQSHTDPF